MSLDENTPDARRFPIMGGRDRALKSVDWSVAEQAREQALTNHGQTLEQLAARGGLDARELLAALKGERYSGKLARLELKEVEDQIGEFGGADE